MPIATIQAPDGKILSVEVPEGATQEQIMSFVSSNYKPQTMDIAKERGDTGERRFLQQPLQGATLGFSDEISGALGGILAKGYDQIRSLTGGEKLFDESTGELIKAGIDTARKDVQQQFKERPLESFGLQVAGGLAGGAAGAGTKAGQVVGRNILQSGTAGRIAKSALLGSGTGAVAGFGGGEGTPEQRLSDAATGAVVGGAIGGVVPAVGALLKTGKNIAIGRDADKILADRLKQQDLSKLKGQLTEKGNISVLADIAGDESRGLLRAVTRRAGGTKDLVTDFLENRSEAAGQRVSNILSQKVSNVDNYFGNLDDLAKARAVVSQANYSKAYEQGRNIKIDKRLNTLLNDTRITSAIDEAKSTYGVAADAPRNSLETLDGVKKVLDDKIGSAMRAGEKQKASVFLNLKDDLVKQIDAQVPAYKKARNVFSGFKALEDAQETGISFTKLDPEEITKLRKGMTAGEHDAFLIGVRKSLQNTVSKTPDNADPAKRIFGNDLIRNKIKAAFPTEDGFNQFSKRMREEIQAADTKFKVLGGSRTDFNLEENGSNLIEAGQRIARGGLKEEITNALFVGVRNRAEGISDKNARKIAKILIDKKQGVEAIDRIIKSQNSTQKKALEQIKPIVNNIKTGLIVARKTE